MRREILPDALTAAVVDNEFSQVLDLINDFDLELRFVEMSL